MPRILPAASGAGNADTVPPACGTRGWAATGTLTWLERETPAREETRSMSYPPQPGGWSDPSYPPQTPPSYNPYDPASQQPVSGQPISGQPMSPLPSAAPYGGYGYPAYAPVAATPSTNGLAIASLICSLVGFATCITFPVGAILGHVARKQIRERGEGGDGMALAGIIVGWIGTVLFIGLIIFYIVIIIAAVGAGSTGSFDDTMLTLLGGTS
jgi:hypothetical protein